MSVLKIGNLNLNLKTKWKKIALDKYIRIWIKLYSIRLWYRTRPSIIIFKPKSKGRPLFGLSTLRRAETSTEEILRFFHWALIIIRTGASGILVITKTYGWIFCLMNMLPTIHSRVLAQLLRKWTSYAKKVVRWLRKRIRKRKESRWGTASGMTCQTVD